MTNKQIARSLRLTADLIELTGGNDFRARAYAGAARRIDGLEEAVSALVERGELTGLPGVGGRLAADIEQLLETGSFPMLEELIEAVPPGLMDVLRVKGLGPKKVRALWERLGISTLDDLEEMALAGRIAALDGFGKKSEERIVEEVRRVRRYLGLRHHAMAVTAVGPLIEALRAAEGVQRAEPAGGLRRGDEVLAQIELVVAGSEDVLLQILSSHARRSDEEGEAFFVGILPDGMTLFVHRAEADRFAAAWWRHTGTTAHVEAFEERFEVMEDAPTEMAIYESVGLAFVPPELREGADELEAADEDRIPRLIEVGDLRGTLHNHTTASDGVHTLREMAEAARAMGYSYLGICDHSRSLAIANGLSIERLQAQAEEIRALNAEFGHDGGTPFRIFHGSEVDILSDGSLDYPDDVLAELDFVVASIHTGFGMTEDAATERLIRAVEHPLVDILGHVTGRLLLRREGYPVDHSAVIAACARHGVAIELNANPYRLDMDWRFIREATRQDVPIAINPDAHSVEELRFVQWGVGVARKGWLTAAQCLNALEADEFEAWLGRRRGTVEGKTDVGRPDPRKSSELVDGD